MDEVVRFQTVDGTWEVGGVDRRNGIWPEDLQCSWDDWGPKTAHFTLKREPGIPYPDIKGLTPVVIEKGRGVWEGFVDQTPQADENSLGVECLGWPDHGNDILSRRMFIHENLADWQDWRTHLEADLTKFKTSFNVVAGGGAIVINGPTVADGSFPRGGVYIDLGPSLMLSREATAHSIRIDWEKNPWAGTSAAYVSFGDEPGDLDAGSTLIVNLTTDVRTSAEFALTFSSNVRYIRIHCDTNAAQATDRFFRINAIRLFNSITYESSGQSVLTASKVLKVVMDAGMVSEWNSDTSGISATTFVIPSLVLNDLRSFREIAETINAFHGYIRKLKRGRKFTFKPRPLVPMFVAGCWPGLSFRDQSKNATRDLYNVAIGVGQTPDGVQIMSRRHAAQVADFPGQQIASAFLNPGFETNTTGWAATTSTITRTTTAGQFTLGVAGGSWNGSSTLPFGATLTTNLQNALDADVAYRITFWARSGGSSSSILMQVGLSNDIAFGRIEATGTFKKFQLVWVPKGPITAGNGHLDFVADKTSTSGIYIDDFTLEVVKPTLLDRLGRERDKVISMPAQAVSVDVLDRFADIWLHSHMKTQSRGSLEIQGRALQLYADGTPVDPFEIGESIGELVCLLTEIDPDTGTIGRNIPVVDVSYNGATESASLSLDSANEDFERVVSRYEMLISHMSAGSGGGSLS